jgi:two-component system sensor histidine kinase PilS (NtrC family)
MKTLPSGAGETVGEPTNGNPGAASPSVRLLVWRMWLAAFLGTVCLISYQVAPERLIVAGLVSSLGLMCTTLAASWAAAMARAPGNVLLAFQLLADTVIIALLVHFSGGPFSPLPLVFCIPIILGAYYLGRTWAMILAGAAAVFTGGGHFGLALGWLMAGNQSVAGYTTGWPVMVTSIHMGIFLIVGIASGEQAIQLDRRQKMQLRNVLQVRQARSEVRNILDNIRSGLLTIDKRGIISRVNPSCCRILQMEPGDLLGRPIDQVLQSGLQELADIIAPVAQGAEAVSRGEVMVKRLGRDIPLGLNVNHMTTSKGAIVGAIAIFTDLTKEKEMTARMREADRLAAVGELAASIAHEIRNPLASLTGSVEMLQDELELEDYQEQLFALVLKESSRVYTIINDFLTYSRMRPAQIKRFNASDFMTEFQLQMKQHITRKNGQVQFGYEVHPEGVEITADPEQLTQMTLNLGINACEAMNYRGRLNITLGVVDDGQTIELLVTDNGPGIEDEIRDHLFSPFKTTKEEGTGLGLSAVNRIATSHGGIARAEDAPGGGSTFRIRWPLHRDPDIPYTDLSYQQAEFRPESENILV